jgi:hypothetical protein
MVTLFRLGLPERKRRTLCCFAARRHLTLLSGVCGYLRGGVSACKKRDGNGRRDSNRNGTAHHLLFSG